MSFSSSKSFSEFATHVPFFGGFKHHFKGPNMMCFIHLFLYPTEKKLVLCLQRSFFLRNDLSDFHGNVFFLKKGTRSFQGSNTHPDSTLILLYYLISELHHLLTLKLVSFCSSCPGSPTTIFYRLVYILPFFIVRLYHRLKGSIIFLNSG